MQYSTRVKSGRVVEDERCFHMVMGRGQRPVSVVEPGFEGGRNNKKEKKEEEHGSSR